MKTTKATRDFIPNIDTANEEIDRLNAKIAELEAKAAAKPEPAKTNAAVVTQDVTEKQAALTVEKPKLIGLSRAIAANIKQQSK